MGVTVTVSKSVAILRTTFTSLEGATGSAHSANPPARTIIVRLPLGTSVRVNRPSGPRHGLLLETVRPQHATDAPETTPLASSRTIPDTVD